MKKKSIHDLTQAMVQELLDYDKETGKLFWKEREVKWFKDSSINSAEVQANRWNKMFANKEAFTAKNQKGHKQGSILGIFTKAHRIIWLWMTGELPIQVDHENGCASDNRWFNLRNVTNSENQRNVSRRKDNKSGFTGVAWQPRQGNWAASICHEGRNRHLGTFEDFEAAVKARQQANIDYGYHKNHGRPKSI